MKAAKTQRIDLRLSSDAKVLIGRAARLRQSTISSYVVKAAEERAREEIQELERLHLGEADWNRFYAALLNPPEPNEALKKLMRSA
jgi:uncharacterized protein (DUF1778 family)